MQREVFRQLLHLFDVFIFGPPLDTLGPGERAALLIDFRQFSIIDEELYEQLLSEKYPAVFAGAREAAERESVASDEYSDTSEGSGESDGAEESVFFGNKMFFLFFVWVWLGIAIQSFFLFFDFLYFLFF